MTSGEKCIRKYEKRIAHCKKMMANKHYGHLLKEEPVKVILIEEFLKDLHRLLKI